MAPLPHKGHVKQVAGGTGIPLGNLHCPKGDGGLTVHDDTGVHPVQRPLLDHKAGAARPVIAGLADRLLHRGIDLFLSGLEEKFNFPGEGVGVLGQHLGRPQQHGDMAVVPAGVHTALVLGLVVAAGQFLNPQAVHIGPHHQCFSRFA